MTMNPLPPQAYTKDTLLRAYHWVQTQPPNIKELALTPDILVSLYLKAFRDGDQSLERPSIQNFKSELKSLAGLMGDLEKPEHSPQPSQGTAATQISSHQPQRMQQPPPPQQQTRTAPPPQPEPAVSRQQAAVMAATSASWTPSPDPRPAGQTTLRGQSHREAAVSFGLDEKTLELVREIQNQFNLSSETEACRMLLKIGYSKAKDFF